MSTQKAPGRLLSILQIKDIQTFHMDIFYFLCSTILTHYYELYNSFKVRVVYKWKKSSKMAPLLLQREQTTLAALLKNMSVECLETPVRSKPLLC